MESMIESAAKYSAMREGSKRDVAGKQVDGRPDAATKK